LLIGRCRTTISFPPEQQSNQDQADPHGHVDPEGYAGKGQRPLRGCSTCGSGSGRGPSCGSVHIDPSSNSVLPGLSVLATVGENVYKTFPTARLH
jgi:hypothetical protein